MTNASRRITTIITAARTASRAVLAIAIVETLAVLVASALAARAALGLAGMVQLDELPRWRSLTAFPLAGAAAYVLRALRPVEALSRWHGVAIRRIDERWGDER